MNKIPIGKIVKSPYDLWLSHGNTGTELDYLESLKGPKGDPGGKNFEDLVFVGFDENGNSIVKSKFSDGSYGSEFIIQGHNIELIKTITELKTRIEHLESELGITGGVKDGLGEQN
ncbi:MAG: hypothetical protein ACRC92_20265 [Peptostreptococcaceae bacterium]